MHKSVFNGLVQMKQPLFIIHERYIGFNNAKISGISSYEYFYSSVSNSS